MISNTQLVILAIVALALGFSSIVLWNKVGPRFLGYSSCQECRDSKGECVHDKHGNFASCKHYPHGNPAKGGELFRALPKPDAYYTFAGHPQFPL